MVNMGLMARCDLDHRFQSSSSFRQLRKRASLAKALFCGTEIKGTDMAGNGDMKAHRETYESVMSLLKWGTVGTFIIGAIVVVLIGS
jgi:Bacterial aa3 type cytochrome c oxidase subunit IV